MEKSKSLDIDIEKLISKISEEKQKLNQNLSNDEEISYKSKIKEMEVLLDNLRNEKNQEILSLKKQLEVLSKKIIEITKNKSFESDLEKDISSTDKIVYEKNSQFQKNKLTKKEKRNDKYAQVTFTDKTKIEVNSLIYDLLNFYDKREEVFQGKDFAKSIVILIAIVLGFISVTQSLPIFMILIIVIFSVVSFINKKIGASREDEFNILVKEISISLSKFKANNPDIILTDKIIHHLVLKKPLVKNDLREKEITAKGLAELIYNMYWENKIKNG